MSKQFDLCSNAPEYFHTDDESQTSTDQDTELGIRMNCNSNSDPRTQFWQTVRYSVSGHAIAIVVLGALWSILVHYCAPEYDYGVALVSSLSPCTPKHTPV